MYTCVAPPIKAENLRVVALKSGLTTLPIPNIYWVTAAATATELQP